MPSKNTLKLYYVLSKPGIIYANCLTALAGYLFASHFSINATVLLGLISGLALLIAGGCAANNYLDRNIDAAMQRTKTRGLVTGDIAPWQAVTYAVVTTVTGTALLALTQNMTTLVLALTAYVAYVVLYGYSKRKTIHGTLVGTISGSIPLVAGYTAVTGHIDLIAYLLFILMAAWQMAHFYAIALYRRKDYAAAHIPVMPVVRGEATTKKQIIAYEVLFIIMSVVLAVASDIGVIAGTALVMLGSLWLQRSLSSYKEPKSDQWGKHVFLFSLTVMLGMTGLLAVGPLLV